MNVGNPYLDPRGCKRTRDGGYLNPWRVNIRHSERIIEHKRFQSKQDAQAFVKEHRA